MDKETKKIIKDLLFAYENKGDPVIRNAEKKAVRNAEAAIDETKELIDRGKKLLLDIEACAEHRISCVLCSAYTTTCLKDDEDKVDLIRGLVRELESGNNG